MATRGKAPAKDTTTTAKKSKSPSSNNASHGFMFEVKLLTLFLIRATAAGYQFELTTNAEKLGGKLDDLIFKYLDDAPNGRQWRYRYLQAKHREDEGKKIQADHLLKDSGDFSLGKYFRSYCRIKARGEDVQDCIICTNINFNVADLKANGIELVPYDEPDDILVFEENLQSGKTPARYRLKKTDNLREKLMKTTDIQGIADKLSECVVNKTTLGFQPAVFKTYHIALVEENVIDLTGKPGKFHNNFIDETNLASGAAQLRQIISDQFPDDWRNWTFQFNPNFGKRDPTIEGNPDPQLKAVTCDDVEDFLDKLVFLVDTPKENEFESILQACDVSKFYKSEESKTQTERISKEMLDWFKNSEKKSIWLTHDDGRGMLLSGVTKVSVDYQNDVLKSTGMEFNDDAVCEIAEKLEFFLSDSSNKLLRIMSPLPKCTAAKIIVALKTMETNSDDSYLTMSSKCLQDTGVKERLKSACALNGSYRLLILVFEDNDSMQDSTFYLDLIPDNQKEMTVILIGEINVVNHSNVLHDTISYHHLSESTRTNLLSKTISFQKTDRTVKDLIGDGDPYSVIDVSSIQELLFWDDKVTIHSSNMLRFDPTLYIKRNLTLSESLFDEQFWDKISNGLSYEKKELQRQFKLDQTGSIEWLVDDDKKSKIWEAIRNFVEKDSQATKKYIPENDLINENTSKGRITIISGVAGTGKSTILSQRYEEIKKLKPDYWIIKANLVDHSENLLKFNFNSTNSSSAIAFFTNHFPISNNNSPFARSLLKHRFEMTGQVTIMLDGFDEIDGQVQDKVIRLMAAISLTKVNNIYVTTRPHLTDQLQNKLFQFAYTMENFNTEDQANYLFDYWKTNLKMSSNENESEIRSFAEDLMVRVSKTLKDEEKSLVGIPLQCHILAMCYQSELQELITTGQKQTDSETQNLNLVTLYKKLMTTKRRVFCDEKAKVPPNNEIISCSVKTLIQKIEAYLTKLAFESLFPEKKDLDTLWPPSSSRKSKSKRAKEADVIHEFGLKFGLTFKEGDSMKVQFLHRTYAEFLVAKYLYKGFLVDDDKHNELLDSEPCRQLIAHEVLVNALYNGVRVFLDAFLKEIVENQEWRSLIDKRLGPLPARMQFFIEEIYRRRSIFVTDCKVLLNATESKNVNIFKFICDCLDAALHKHDIRRFISFSFRNYSDFFNAFSEQSNEVLKRCIDYYDDADDSVIHFILEEYVLNNNTIGILQVLNRNEENINRNFHLILDFIKRHREAWKKLMQEYIGENFMLKCLIVNEHYDCVLKRYLKILSWTFPNESSYIKVLEKSMKLNNNTGNNHLSDRIVKMLTILRELEQISVVERLSRLVLVWWPRAFDDFYMSCLPRDEVTTDIHLLFAQHSTSHMTRLHQMAFYGDMETLEWLLRKARDALASGNKECPEAKKILNCLTCDDNKLTPFYVAAASGHTEMCNKLLQFCKDLPADQSQYDLTKIENGYLTAALSDAIFLMNANMLQVILMGVKKILGQDILIALLKSGVSEDDSDRYVVSVFAACSRYDILFQCVTASVTENGADEEYQHLNELIFYDIAAAGIMASLCNIQSDTLKRMLTVHGCESWTNRLLQLKLNHGFELISNYILKRLDKDQRSQVLQAVISLKDNGKSYLVEWLNYQYWASERMHKENKKISSQYENYRDSFLEERRKCQYDGYDKFLKCVSENMGEVAVKEMALHDNGRAITYAFLLNQNKIFDSTVACLSSENRGEVGKSVVSNLLDVIEEMLPKRKKGGKRRKKHKTWKKIQKKMRQRVRVYWVNMLHLVVEFADNQLLSNLVQFISIVRNLNGKRCSLWSDSFEDDDYYYEVENGIEKLDSFLRCVSQKLGETTLKELLLHNDGDVITRALLCYGDNLFNVMLAYLSKESREEITTKLLVKIPQTMEEIFLDPERRHCLYWMNIINFIEAYSDDRDHLQNVVNTISILHDLEGVKVSIWSDFLCDVEEYQDFTDKLNSFLKLVSETLGERAVKKLLLHDEGKAITCALLRYDETLANVLLAYLSKEEQVKVGKCVIDNTHQLAEQFFLHKQPKCIPSWMNTLQFLLDYADDGQLSKIVDVILKKPSGGKVVGRTHINSIWGAYMDAIFYNYPASISIVKNAQVEKVDKFLKCVSEKLDQGTVKILLLHDNDQAVIRRAALRGQHNLVETMLSHLNEQDRDEVRRKFVVKANNNSYQ